VDWVWVDPHYVGSNHADHGLISHIQGELDQDPPSSYPKCGLFSSSQSRPHNWFGSTWPVASSSLTVASFPFATPWAQVWFQQ
jgi:hypothetical protein